MANYKGDPTKPWTGPYSGDGSYDDYQKAVKDLNDPYLQWVRNWDPSKMPDYQGAGDKSGNLTSNYTLNARPDVAMDANIQSNPWVQMMLQTETMQRGKQLDDFSANNNAGTASAFGNLASRGGLRAGAAERIAGKGGRDLLFGRQEVNRQGDINRNNTMTTGMDKQAQLDLQYRSYATDVDSKNISTRLADAQGQNTYNLGKYQTQAQAWGADRTATAQENAGKK